MFRKNLFLGLTFFFLISSVGSSQTLIEFNRKKNLEFIISIEKDSYLSHEPLWIHCLIKNNTSESIPAYIPSYTQTSVVITDISGDTVCCKLEWSEELGRPSTERFLEPGEEWYFCKVADKELEVGEYSLQVLYPADPYFYMDDFQKESTGKWNNIDVFLQYMHTGDLLSNKLSFKVEAPKTMTDNNAYSLLQKILDEQQNRKGGSYQEFLALMETFMEDYAHHPYAALVYPSYLCYLQRDNPSRYREIVDSVVSSFPNTTLAYGRIHERALDITNEEEREKYFQKLIKDYSGQWLSKYVFQLDKRFDAAEASGWSMEAEQKRAKEILNRIKGE